METADVLVVGLGAMGAACALGLARRGARVIGLDRFQPPHDRGSTHGGSRITRQAIGEGAEFVPLALRSHELWRQLEAETGRRLMDAVGALVIGHEDADGGHAGKPWFVRETLRVARDFHIAHESLTPDEAMRRHPALRLRGDESVYFEPGAGLLRPEACVAAQLDRARALGADLRGGVRVLSLEAGPDGVVARTDQGEIAAGRVIVAAGAWNGELLGRVLAPRLTLWRQVMHWFEPEQPRIYAPDRLPVFIWMHGQGDTGFFYGFPSLDGEAAVKVADERFVTPLNRADDHDPDPRPGEAEAAWRDHLHGRMAGLKPGAVHSRACLYANTVDSRFIIGAVPGRERLIVVSACSGHGFKHSAAIGEAVADLALDGAPPPVLRPFAP